MSSVRSSAHVTTACCFGEGTVPLRQPASLRRRRTSVSGTPNVSESVMISAAGARNSSTLIGSLRGPQPKICPSSQAPMADWDEASRCTRVIGCHVRDVSGPHRTSTRAPTNRSSKASCCSPSLTADLFGAPSILPINPLTASSMPSVRRIALFRAMFA